VNKPPNITLREGLPEPNEYFRLFESTGWNHAYGASEAELYSAIEASWFTLSAYNRSDELVGFGRVVSDGLLYAFVCDMIIYPQYQLQGIGSMIMKAMLERCSEAGIRVVWLFSASGKSGFYRRHGFHERPSSAPGMEMNLGIEDGA